MRSEPHQEVLEWYESDQFSQDNAVTYVFLCVKLWDNGGGVWEGIHA